MKKKLLGILIVFLLSVLTGCATKKPADDSEKMSRIETGFISGISGNQILVNDIFFDISEAEVVTDQGEPYQKDRLEIGSYVETPRAVGPILESYPAQAKSEKLLVFIDEDSLRLKEGVAAVVRFSESEGGKPVVLHKVEFVEDKARLRINLTAGLESGSADFVYDYETKSVLN